MDYLSALLGIAVGMIGIYVGYTARHIVHQKVPWKDPIFVILLMAELIVAIALWVSSAPVTMPDGLVITILAIDVGYPLGYVMAKPGDNVYVDLIDGSLNSDTVEIFHYYRCGEHLYMPQSLIACIKALSGVKNTIEMDLSLARRTKRRSIDNHIWPLSVSAYITSMHTVEIEPVGMIKIWTSKVKGDDGDIIRLPRYLIHTYREIHSVTFAESTLEDPLEYELKTDTYIAATAAAAEARAEAARAKIYAATAPFDGAASILTNMIRLDVDAAGAADDILRRIGAERDRRKAEGGDAGDDLS